MTIRRSIVFLLLFSFLAFKPCGADVRMPAIFGPHMVLQQESKIPVWGWADAGEAVTVTLGTHTAKTTADAAGKWRVDLDPVMETSTPLTLTVAGRNSLKFDDVLIGDVWVCSGQSNMAFGLKGAHNSATELPKANDPQLRVFIVGSKIALEPETDVKGMWRTCSPEDVGSFSAVGYFFGRELRQQLKRPIGLIGSYWGGTPAQSWTSESGLQKEPPFTQYLADHQKVFDGYPKAKADYPGLLASFQEQTKQWEATYGAAYDGPLKEWHQAVLEARAKGEPEPPKPVAPAPLPKPPVPPEGGPMTPTVLYNGMIAPLIPYAIKGAIWYQGESNGHNGVEYRTLFPRMITDWREKWNEGNFPFLFVQLANYGKPQVKPSEGGWAYVREAQLKALALPKTGMASAVDIGNGADIHPKDKLDVGLRLALAARHVAYGEKLVYSGPIYDEMKIEGNKIRLTFKRVGAELKMGTPPWTPTGTPLPKPTELTGFAIAGADKNFVWAEAKIDGDDVVVSSDKVSAPVAVRYGWADNPPCDLYDQEGLPASPFRTDDWVLPEPGTGLETVAPPVPPAPAPAANAPTP